MMIEHRLVFGIVGAALLLTGCHTRQPPAPSASAPGARESAYLLVDEAGEHRSCPHVANVARQPAAAIAKLEATIRARATVYIPSVDADNRCDAWQMVDEPMHSGVLVRTEQGPSNGSSQTVTTYRMPFLLDRVCQALEIDGASTRSQNEPLPRGIGGGPVESSSACISQDALVELNDSRARFGDTYWYFQAADCERDVRSKRVVAASGKRGGC